MTLCVEFRRGEERGSIYKPRFTSWKRGCKHIFIYIYFGILSQWLGEKVSVIVTDIYDY